VKLQAPLPASNSPGQRAAGGAERGGEQDARQEGRTRGADVGVGGDQSLLGGEHVGARQQDLGRQADRNLGHQGLLRQHAPRGQRGAAADQQAQGVFGGGGLAA
jgi:hypothetical protein